MPMLNLPRVLLSWLSLAILAAAIWLLWDWSQGEMVARPDGVLVRVRPIDWRLGLGAGLLAWSFLGRLVVLALIPGKPDEPRRRLGAGEMIQGPQGAALRTDRHGAGARGGTVVLTHGWGLNSSIWTRTTEALKDRFSLMTWDLPGMGRSQRLRHYSIDALAEALGAVVGHCEGRVVLVGHSIGGMATQTFWRACPAALRARVAGLVLVNTTYHDPLDTMLGARFWRAIQKPVLEPLNMLAPLVSLLLWLSNWQSYLSGSAQLATRLVGFGRYASRGEVDFTTRLTCLSSPGVQARGNLAMMRWSAEEVLPRIDVPVLVIGGEKDILTLPRASRRMARTIPGAALREVEGVGHMGLLERAETYNQAIAEFAEAVLGG